MLEKKQNVRYITSYPFRFQHKCYRIRPEEHIFIHGLVAFSLCCARAGAGWICVSGAGSQCGDRARRAAVRKFFHPRCTEGASPSRLAILVPSFRLDEGKRGGTSSLCVLTRIPSLATS